MEIVQVDFIFRGKPSVVIRGAVSCASLHSRTGEPHGEAFRIVIASIASALRGWGASEFAAPNHQRVLEQAARLQIPEQAGNRLVNLRRILGVTLSQIAVLIPLDIAIAVRDLMKRTPRSAKRRASKH